MKKYIRVLIACLFISFGSLAGFVTIAEANGPCFGRCNYDDYTEFLGDSGYCKYKAGVQTYGCDGNDGSQCRDTPMCSGL